MKSKKAIGKNINKAFNTVIAILMVLSILLPLLFTIIALLTK